jgi:hypothetical protein
MAASTPSSAWSASFESSNERRWGRPRDFGRAAAAPGVLALAVMFDARIHASLVPEHLEEMSPLGLVVHRLRTARRGAGIGARGDPEDQLFARPTALFLTVEILGWVLFVSAAVPGFDGTPEPIETIAFVSLRQAS